MRGLERLRELASSVLVAGFSGPDPRGAELSRLRRLSPSGVILFARNVQSAAQVRGLTRLLADELDHPLVLLDQEGGRVDRLRPLLGSGPSPRRLASLGEGAVARHADETAHALAVLGVNFNCAPVLDLDEGDPRNGLLDRCLSDDPGEAARLGRLVLEAHARHGVLSCLKHFPGLGRTDADTHATRPVVRVPASELLGREVVPFRLLLDRAPSVMVSHAAFPGLGGEAAPASLCPAVVAGLLRRDLGYDGLVLTDDLEMGAVTDHSPGERAVLALAAGCDLLLYCSRLDEAEQGRDALVEAAASGRLPVERLREASARVAAARREATRVRVPWAPEHDALLARIAVARREALG